MNTILKKLENKLKNRNVLFTDEHDVYYLTRFKSSNIKVLLANKKWYAITDSRYIESAINSIKNMSVVNMSDKEWLKKIISENNFNEIYLNSSSVTLYEFSNYKKIFKEKYNIEVKEFNYGYIRDVYLPNDIKLLKESLKINEEIFENVLNKIKIGMSEIDVEKIILKEIIDSPAEKPSFDPIVAVGSNGSHPHWTASNKIINENELITIDMGVFYKGFASDMTRTFTLGDKLSDEEKKIWNIVKETVDVSIKAIKPGVPTKKLHNLAIETMKKYGYDKYFTHSLGHGLGVEIHDDPVISKNSNDVLNEGSIITIEPGIYIAGKYGVRLEQEVLVVENGYEVLNKNEIKLFVKNEN